MQLTLDTPIKFLNADGGGPYQGTKWHLPTQWSPGKPMRQYVRPPILCKRGWHYTTLRYWHHWQAARCFLIEPAGTIIGPSWDGKYASQGARLTRELTTWHNAHRYIFESLLVTAFKKYKHKVPASYFMEQHYLRASMVLSRPDVLPLYVPIVHRHRAYDYRDGINTLIPYVAPKFDYFKTLLAYLQEEVKDV